VVSTALHGVLANGDLPNEEDTDDSIVLVPMKIEICLKRSEASGSNVIPVEIVEDI
jgi:hypothetical protein